MPPGDFTSDGIQLGNHDATHPIRQTYCHMSHLTISFHSKHIGTINVLKIWLSHLYGLTYFYIQHWTRIMATIVCLTRCKFLIQIYIQVVPGSGVGCEQHQVQMIKVVTETQCSGGDGDIMKLLYWLLALPPSYIQSNQSVHIQWSFSCVNIVFGKGILFL